MGKKKLQHDFDFAVNLNCWSMRILGLWPIDDDRFSELRFLLAFVVLILTLIPVVIYCFVTTSIFKDLDVIVLIISFVSALMKHTLIRIHKTILKPLVEEISEDWKNAPKLSLKSRNLMVSDAKGGRKLNLYLIIFIYSSAFFYLMTPIFLSWKRNSVNETVQSLPFKSYYPGDFETSPFYEFLYISQIISGLIIGTIILSADCFVAVIVSHLCGQLQIVAQRIQNLNNRNIKHSNFMNIQDCECLKCIIERHIQLIRNSEIIQETFDIIMLVQVTGNVFVLCIQGYTIIKVSSSRNMLSLLSYILYAICSTFNVFIDCYIGERLIDKSTSVGHKVYEVKWHNINPELVRLMLIIIIRSQKPLELTAGHFFSMSLATYKNIIMSAFSYASFLLALSQNNPY